MRLSCTVVDDMQSMYVCDGIIHVLKVGMSIIYNNNALYNANFWFSDSDSPFVR